MGHVQLTISFCCCMVFFIMSTTQARVAPVVVAAELKLGFYRHKCPSAEDIVRRVVREAVAKNPGFAPGLVRMHFHDCFVRGCDGSILLDSTAGGNLSEKASPVNNPSLGGFEVIDEAKGEIESFCPSTVSCADILAFAARDATALAGGIRYRVPAGRRDGRVSLSSEVFQNLPPPSLTASQLKDNFARKGLTLDEMVTLSGAHSFGVSHCSSFSNRLYGFNATHPQDPSMDPGFAAYLKTRCPQSGGGAGVVDPTVDMDLVSPNRMDSQYYRNLRQHRGLFTSDQTLHESPLTARMVEANARSAAMAWKAKFAAAMVRMGSIQVLTGNQGEIRKKCNVVL